MYYIKDWPTESKSLLNLKVYVKTPKSRMPSRAETVSLLIRFNTSKE